MHWSFIVLPFLILIVLSIVFRVMLWKGSIITYLFAVISVGVVAGFDLVPIPLSIGNGFLTAIELATILFGAIFFLHFLKNAHVIQEINDALTPVFTNSTERILVLVWLLGGFIEGCSGFGTPAMIIAPMLIGFGLNTKTAVVVSLLANTTAVTFGAVGTPIHIGFANIDTQNVGLYTAGLNLVIAVIIPIWLVRIIQKDTADKDKKTDKIPVYQTLIYAFSFLVPYCLTAMFDGNFPSIVGGASGLLVMLILRYYTNKNSDIKDYKRLLNAFMPYIFLTLFLLAGKLLLSDYRFTIALPGGAKKAFSYFQPGSMFFMASIVTWLFDKKRFSTAPIVLITTVLKTIFKPFILVLFLASLAHHTILLEKEMGMINLLSEHLNAFTLAAISPWIGAFGSFVVGSATVSNLLFGNELFSMATLTQASTAWILALQLVGAGIGNALAFQNIVTVQAAIQTEGMEVSILKKLILPCFIYLMLASVAGVIVQYFIFYDYTQL